MSAIPNLLSPLLSLGLGYARTEFSDTSKVVTQIPTYEIFAQSYLTSPWDDIFLRPAVRFAYDSTSSLESPAALSISETTHKSALELGILYNGLLVPTLTLQGGLAVRRLVLNRKPPIDTDAPDDLTDRESLWTGGLTLGLGLPIADGMVVLEPFWRIVRIQRDDRQKSQWGCDLSFALPILRSADEK